MPEFHQEQYIYLAGLTHKSALIAWGAFYFKVKGKSEDQRFKLVDDSDLKHIHPPRHQTIGASSEPFGDATVEVRDASSGELVAGGTTSVANHLLVTGLLPDTEYTYKISVNGDEWAAGERRDWVARDDDNEGLEKSGRVYNNRFRTHPHPEISAPLTFAVLGDFSDADSEILPEDDSILEQDAYTVRHALTFSAGGTRFRRNRTAHFSSR